MFVISFLGFLAIAIMAHILVWQWRPWIPGTPGYPS
jgi:light-harvesting complex 1 beta chain